MSPQLADAPARAQRLVLHEHGDALLQPLPRLGISRQIGRNVVFDLHPAGRDRGKDQQRGKDDEKQPVMVDDPFRCTVQRGRFLIHNGITTPYPDKNAGVDFLITER